MKRVLVALGGNAIKKADERGTFTEQMDNVATACEQIAEIAREGYKLVLTHGNGPQVGNLAIQQERAADVVPTQPLVILGSMTQGQIGYMIQQNLCNILKSAGRWRVATLVTQVLVSRDDPDFQDPSKPVGPFYTEADARELAEENNWIFKKVLPGGERAWRRVVPSPKPLRIVEADAIRCLVDSEVIVIASGGGGIPVYRNENGYLKGIDAVIDKDRAGAKLAEEVDANILLILTDVEYAMKNYGKKSEAPIGEITFKEAEKLSEEGHFGAGSMGPKIDACTKFVGGGGERAIITSLDKAMDAMREKTGTHIIRA